MTVRLTIRFEGSVHHGSGYGIAGLVDKSILRDGDGIPYLSGSSLKGRFRNALLRMEHTQGSVSPCVSGDAPGYCRTREGCPICRRFGSALRRGEWEFADAYPIPELRRAAKGLESIRAGALFLDTTIRSQTAMDRGTGKVQDQLLFSTESLDGGWEFETSVSGVGEADFESLSACAFLVSQFGSGRSRGFGRCEIKAAQQPA